jgi:hypothetical protein
MMMGEAASRRISCAHLREQPRLAQVDNPLLLHGELSAIENLDCSRIAIRWPSDSAILRPGISLQ